MRNVILRTVLASGVLIVLRGETFSDKHLFDAVRLTAHINTKGPVSCHEGLATLLFEKNGVEFFAPPENLRLAEKLGKDETVWEIFGNGCTVQIGVRILSLHGDEMRPTEFDNR